jgi:hypothetical protein
MRMFKMLNVSRSVLTRSAQVLALALLAGAAQYAPNAEARGGHRFGYFIGGAVVGAAMFAPRYAYPSPYYYPAPVYYQPAVTYVTPAPVVVQQVAPIVTQPVVPQVVVPAAPVARQSIEDRAQRLRSMCEQGLFTSEECRVRREQILQEM